MTTETQAFFGRPDFQRGKFGWAKIAQPDGTEKLYRRATTVAGYMEDKEGLINWKSAMTAFGLAKSASVRSALAVLDWKNDKDKVKDLVSRAQELGGGSDAADLGTAFHRVVERHVAGETIDYESLPENFGESLDAFIAFGEATGLSVEASELTVVDDAHEVAGTADAVFSFASDVQTPFGTLSAGTGIIGDFKTGSVSELSGLKMAQQLSIYSHADPYEAGRGVRTDWPCELNSDIGLVLKVDLEAATVTPWWLDLKAAYEWVEMSLKVASIRTKARKAIVQADVSGSDYTPALGAREVGKLITSATTLDELKGIETEHGSVFTDALKKRHAKKVADVAAQTLEDTEPEATIPETLPEPEPIGVEIRSALGAAETIDDLRAVYKKYAKSMTQEQKDSVLARVEKLKAAEVPTDDAGEWSLAEAQKAADAAENKGILQDLYRKWSRVVNAGDADPETLVIISTAAAKFA